MLQAGLIYGRAYLRIRRFASACREHVLSTSTKQLANPPPNLPLCMPWQRMSSKARLRELMVLGYYKPSRICCLIDPNEYEAKRRDTYFRTCWTLCVATCLYVLTGRIFASEEMVETHTSIDGCVQRQGLQAAFEAALHEFELSMCADVSARIRSQPSQRRDVQLIPHFLNDEEVKECWHAASLGQWRAHDESAWARSVDEDGDVMPDRITLCENLVEVAHDMVFSEKHVAYYLHRERYFQLRYPQLFRKLFQAMLSRLVNSDVSGNDLNVRCIEMHTYVAGGGLLSAGHRDHGSVLTMAVLLSREEDFDGGQFVTYTEGRPVFHDMARGDALIFDSEELHNVTTILRGKRCSLVIELWVGPTNTRNRFS